MTGFIIDNYIKDYDTLGIIVENVTLNNGSIIIPNTASTSNLSCNTAIVNSITVGSLSVNNQNIFNGTIANLSVENNLFASNIMYKNILFNPFSQLLSNFFVANNNISIPVNTNLSFSNTTSFHLTVNIHVIKMNFNSINLFQTFYINGLYTHNGWLLFPQSFGDDCGIQFYITHDGTIQYTSVNHDYWISTIFRYHSNNISNNINFYDF